MILRLILFLIANFSALGIGSLFTGNGVNSDWYQQLQKAPWTPPGWFFGFAWTTIMICFAIYMAKVWEKTVNKNTLIGLFVIQWILNVIWNPTFFYYQNVTGALIIITLLTILIAYLLFGYMSVLKVNALWIAPYFLWLLVATSLNAYILVNN